MQRHKSHLSEGRLRDDNIGFEFLLLLLSFLFCSFLVSVYLFVCLFVVLIAFKFSLKRILKPLLLATGKIRCCDIYYLQRPKSRVQIYFMNYFIAILLELYLTRKAFYYSTLFRSNCEVACICKGNSTTMVFTATKYLQ